MYLDALIFSYAAHLASGRCQDPEAVKEEIKRLKDIQREIVKREEVV